MQGPEVGDFTSKPSPGFSGHGEIEIGIHEAHFALSSKVFIPWFVQKVVYRCHRPSQDTVSLETTLPPVKCHKGVSTTGMSHKALADHASAGATVGRVLGQQAKSSSCCPRGEMKCCALIVLVQEVGRLLKEGVACASTGGHRHRIVLLPDQSP